MSGDVHVRFCERLGVKIPRPTRLACSTAGAEASTILYSILETAKLNGIDPIKYVAETLKGLAMATSADDLGKLLPLQSNLVH